jgi:uncharacterized protein YuzE
MQSSFDKEADALYIRLLEGDCQCRVVRVTDDISLDLAAGEQLVGIEAPGASHSLKDLQPREFDYNKPMEPMPLPVPGGLCRGDSKAVLAQFDYAGAMRM